MIIGVCGYDGSGKSTLARYLVEKYGFIEMSFASLLKDVVAILFDWKRELLEGDTKESREFRETVDAWWSQRLEFPGLTPRKALQFIGTDLFRNHFREDFWIAAVERKLERHHGKDIVFGDCRFPNEMDMIQKLDGRILRVARLAAVTTLTHISQYAWVDYVKTSPIVDCIENDSTIENLCNVVDYVLFTKIKLQL